MPTTIYDGTFTGGPTSAGAAGNTTACPDIAATGTANSWKDVAGGLFHLDSSNNLIGIPQSDFTKWLVRPIGEAVQDQSETVYLTYTGVGNKADILLRINGTNAYWWEVRTSGTSAGVNQYALYSLIAGAPTVIRGDASAYTGWTTGHNYYIKVSAVGVSPTTLTLTIYDITTSTQVYTDSHTDSTAGLQTTGVAGLQAWNGTATDVPVATRIIIKNEAAAASFSVSPTTATTSTSEGITATGSSTSWVSGTTTFSVTGGTGASISSLSINNGTQVATFTLNPGSAPGTLTIHDSTDSATATVTVSNPSPAFTVLPTTATTGSNETVTATGTNTSWVSGTTTFSVTGGTGASISGLSINNGTQVATFTLTPGSAPGTLTIHDSLDSATATITASSPGTLTLGALSVSANDNTGITVGVPVASGGTGTVVRTLYRGSSAITPPGTGTLVGTVSGTTFKDTAPGANDVFYRALATDSVSATALSSQGTYATSLITRQNLPPITLGFFGDSITNYLSTSPAMIPDLQIALPYTAVSFGTNQGVVGTTSVDWASGTTLTSAIAAAVAANCTHINFMIGANDAKSSGGTTTTLPNYITNVTATAAAVLAAGMKIIIHGPLYIVPGSYTPQWDEASLPRLMGYRDALAGIANGTTILLGSVQGFDYFRLNQSLLSDGVHPTSPGNTSLGQLWADGFIGACAVAPTYVGGTFRSGKRSRTR